VCSTSCLEIYEKISFNRDQSGEAIYRFDYSRSIAQFLPLLESASDTVILTQYSEALLDTLSERMQLLTDIDGLSDFVIVRPNNARYVELSFHFNNLSALNDAFSILFISDSLPSSIPTYYISPEATHFYRTDVYNPYFVKYVYPKLDSAEFRNRAVFDTALANLHLHSSFIFRGNTPVLGSTVSGYVVIDDKVTSKISLDTYFKGGKRLISEVQLF
jgi:hypothetical protein